MSRSYLIRLVAFIGLVAILKFAYSEGGESFHSVLDLKAGLLVFVGPVLLLILFQKESMGWRHTFLRLRQLNAEPTEALHRELVATTATASGAYAASQVLKLTDMRADAFFKSAGSMFLSRFTPEEMGVLLSQRIEAEDRHWQRLCNLFGFLAKMAPYFGMLATVIGMVKLLQNMNDFSKISGSMALAMQGTLYGLVSFVMLYAPIQKSLIGYRDEIYQRNEMIAKWFLMIVQKVDPALIREALSAQRFGENEASNLNSERVQMAPTGGLNPSQPGGVS